MAYRAVGKKVTPRCGNNHGVRVSTYSKRDIPIVLGKRDEFERGCAFAGILLVLMFVVMSCGAVFLGW